MFEWKAGIFLHWPHQQSHLIHDQQSHLIHDDLIKIVGTYSLHTRPNLVCICNSHHIRSALFKVIFKSMHTRIHRFLATIATGFGIVCSIRQILLALLYMGLDFAHKNFDTRDRCQYSLPKLSTPRFAHRCPCYCPASLIFRLSLFGN